MSSRNRQRGKEAENGIAEFLGWQRIGTMGREDMRSLDDRFSGESKSVASCVVFKWMLQAEANNEKRKKPRKPGIPVVIVHQRGLRHQNDLAVVRLENFKRLIEYAGPKADLTIETIGEMMKMILKQHDKEKGDEVIER